ncbi:hypothetical protein AAT17_11365 [Nonlabens sp. MIC269]|uniref:hypothetical protein n=1 Tax=Nonlabens sp. MIC269 TaxID=1476901 RepID=UPI0007201158|nr:hypothetical protein [Nonlabens sp. MIC269]ALM21790.1 hypothetical protein AAT17_11365 [Nonlabens sp. MIC269]MEE2802140.1 hypothetical protein [Bacteroidota bacterium]
MSTLYNNLKKDWENHFMMYAALAIIASTCLGGFAVLSIFNNGSGIPQMIQIFLVVTICNIVNASILTVQKPERVLKALIASLIICFLITAINLLF